MATQCPICSRHFASKTVRNQHTSTKKLSLAVPHTCRKCDLRFCSQLAMEMHRDASAHDTMFKCEPCNRTFGERRAVAGHEKGKTHHKNAAAWDAKQISILPIDAETHAHGTATNPLRVGIAFVPAGAKTKTKSKSKSSQNGAGSYDGYGFRGCT
ncbi:hypothetical protein EK21DRAFT_85695 [Setomelanomma holmii]|uniref:C2H2-type domain-containing protein n=1 Tax=Setomelanomma holmii TaxID=210430 RepID=A0A9P4LRE2_9PLEO|nr:hypothetical protein EK21DRAFT_85695 [Setomelanomma holmii]